ncbi:hypothetical protein BJ742DRAFT_757009 [Cladochytrium replicatum]|nr:hypothetical protein BJ742DRAFT_757009 [Cladochytrium replicatum]
MELCNFTPGVIGASCFNATIASMVVSSNVTIEDKLDKRDCVCCGSHSGTDAYISATVTAGGVWWGPWKTASKCRWNGLDSEPSWTNIDWSTSESRSLNGVSGTVGNLWKDILNGNGNFNHGWTFGLSSYRSGLHGCTIPARSNGQVWAQQAMGWSDGQYRNCQRTYVCGAVTKDTCDGWSNSVHQDWVLQDAQNYQLGCSTGDANVKC